MTPEYARHSPWTAGIRPGGMAVALGAAVLVLAFAWKGPTAAPGLAALGVVLLALAVVLPPLGRVLLLPALGSTILLGQVEAGINYFDPVPAVLSGIALVLALLRGDRAAWAITTPGWLSLGWLLVPWLAVPFVVVSAASFLALYKFHVLLVLLFHALRRLVPREHSHALLALFPLIGTIATLQLMAKTQGLGALLFARMSFRNFYSRLAWGQSDFISAVIEFCICGTVLLLLLVRRPWLRVLLVAALVLMFNGFLMLFSRAGVIGFGLFAVIAAIGFGGRKGWMLLAGAVSVALLALATSGGQTTAARFSDPHEFGSVEFRLVIWALGWMRFIHHPWTGIGLNQGRYQHDLMGDEWAANFALDALTEMGVFGGALLLAILGGAFVVARRMRPFGLAGSVRPVRAVAIGTLVQVLAHGSVESTLIGPPMAVLFVFFLAWLALQDVPPAASAREGP
jgi:O-antigen ligase